MEQKLDSFDSFAMALDLAAGDVAVMAGKAAAERCLELLAARGGSGWGMDAKGVSALRSDICREFGIK